MKKTISSSIGLSPFEPLELTSRKEPSQITDTATSQTAYNDDARKGDIVLASSMISVGVDILRLGLCVDNPEPSLSTFSQPLV